MKNAVLLFALAMLCATSAAQTVEAAKQYNWIWDWILINIDFFIVTLVGPWFWWLSVFGDHQALTRWTLSFVNDPIWALSYRK